MNAPPNINARPAAPPTTLPTMIGVSRLPLPPCSDSMAANDGITVLVGTTVVTVLVTPFVTMTDNVGMLVDTVTGTTVLPGGTDVMVVGGGTSCAEDVVVVAGSGERMVVVVVDGSTTVIIVVTDTEGSFVVGITDIAIVVGSGDDGEELGGGVSLGEEDGGISEVVGTWLVVSMGSEEDDGGACVDAVGSTLDDGTGKLLDVDSAGSSVELASMVDDDDEAG